MKTLDYLKAVGVALAILVFTMVASFPMVAVYAYFIEPGHEHEFYNQAAQWIAPWSSYILEPIGFFGFNYWLARKSPNRNAILFAVSTIIAYLIIDFSLAPFLGGELSIFFTIGAVFWVAVKLAGALLGAHMGTLQTNSASINESGT